MIACKAIVFSSLRYQEKSLIVICFTEDRGRRTFFVRDAFSGRSNKFKSSYFEPLTQLDIVATDKQKGTLEYFKEVKLHFTYKEIPHHFVKRSLAMFLAELLAQVIKEEEANKALFAFLEESLSFLDETKNTSDFHLAFLLKLTSFLGFYPEMSLEGTFFDLKFGVFQHFETEHTLDESNSNLLRKLGLENGSSFSKSERRTLLNDLLTFYGHHIDNFRTPKSLNVLVELFG